ncbi:MAG: hypothetical protein AAFY65_15345 [Pseudomonadota bacterium]
MTKPPNSTASPVPATQSPVLGPAPMTQIQTLGPAPITPQTPPSPPAQTLTPVSPPAAAQVPPPAPLSPQAPSGTLSPVVTCCPKAAHFTSTGSAADFYGFDDKTNLVANVGADEYWLPPTKAKSLPSNRETRDGAVWLSVAEGQVSKVVINFQGHSGLGCLSNATFKPQSTAHAKVKPVAITAATATLEVEGGTEGETSIEVVCQGNTVGYIHVACYKTQPFRVAICNINQPAPPPPPPPQSGGGRPPPPPPPPPVVLNLPVPTMTVSGYQTFFDQVFKQPVARVSLNALAGYNLPHTPSVLGGNFFDTGDSMGKAHFIANYKAIRDQTDDIHAAVSARDPGYDYYLYMMPMPNLSPPPPEKFRINGYVNTVGGVYGIFFNTGPGLTSTAAHEFGHLLGLRHPNDTAGASQYAPHLRATSSVEKAQNWTAEDPLNLMGYGHPRPQRKALRYGQWKSIPNR